MSEPTTPVLPFIFDWGSILIRDYDLRNPEMKIMGVIWGDNPARMLAKKGPVQPLKWLQAKLGRPPKELTLEGRRWYCWDDPSYRLYLDEENSLILNAPEGVSPQQCSEHAQWDCGALDRALTRKEHAEWVEVGRKLAEPHIVDFHSRTSAELKQFVLDYCDGRIYCDHQCDPGILSMVFMPLSFGAFGPHGPNEREGTEGSPGWFAQQQLPPHPGDKPKTEPAPKPPEPPEPLPAPLPTEQVQVNMAKISELLLLNDDPDVEVRGIADLFATGDSMAVEEYRESIRHMNEVLEAAHEVAIEKWQAAQAVLDNDHQTALDEHSAIRGAWMKREAGIAVLVEEWERAKAAADAATQGFNMTRLQQLGVIYENIGKAGPRAINGQPIFTSMRTLSKADWQRAYPAITRELERRENMEI